MVSRADRYRGYATICSTVDFASRYSVHRHNRASEQMRALVREAYQDGPEAVAELLPLLDEPPANEWLAFQLLDLGLPAADVVERCLVIVRRKAAAVGADAIGAGMWLRDWEAR